MLARSFAFRGLRGLRGLLFRSSKTDAEEASPAPLHFTRDLRNDIERALTIPLNVLGSPWGPVGKDSQTAPSDKSSDAIRNSVTELTETGPPSGCIDVGSTECHWLRPYLHAIRAFAELEGHLAIRASSIA